MQTQSIIRANFNNELWLGMPKGGRTLGISDEQFLLKSNIVTKDKTPRVDDYTFTDKDTGEPLNIRAFDLKPQMALNLLSQNKLNCAIVGRDVLKEFNYASRGRKGMMQAVELLDMDLSSCAMTVAVQEKDNAQTPQDLNGRVVVTKYPNVVAGWARANNIQFSKIISGINSDGDIAGGIEGYAMFDPSVTVIVDMVQSGESLVRYGWKPLGVKDKDWNFIRDNVVSNVPKTERQEFMDLNPFKLRDMDGVIFQSSAVLVRNSKKLNDKQEEALNDVACRFQNGLMELGCKPERKYKAVDLQCGMKSQKPQRQPRRLLLNATSQGYGLR